MLLQELARGYGTLDEIWWLLICWWSSTWGSLLWNARIGLIPLKDRLWDNRCAVAGYQEAPRLWRSLWWQRLDWRWLFNFGYFELFGHLLDIFRHPSDAAATVARRIARLDPLLRLLDVWSECQVLVDELVLLFEILPLSLMSFLHFDL